MSYRLMRLVIGSSSFIPLSEDEFNNLAHAANNLQLVLSIEEQFDLVVSNYLELETDLLSMATRWMVSMVPDYTYMARERNIVVNRRLMNLLSACRGYLDHTEHHLNNLEGSDAPNYLSDFRKSRSEEYDAHLGYRAMEALRNSTQHRAFPLTLTSDSAWIGEGESDDRKMRVTARPYVDLSRLRADKKFKPAVRDELEGLGEKLAIMPLVRQYVASLGNVHEKIRVLLRSDVDRWDTAVLEAIRRFKEGHPGEKTLGLMAVKEAEDGTKEPRVAVFSKPIEYRRELERKTRNLGTLTRRYVSSEST